MSAVRTLEELIADIYEYSNHLYAIRGLLRSAAATRDRMYADQETITSINARIQALLDDIENKIDDVAFALEDLNFDEFAVLVVPNHELEYPEFTVTDATTYSTITAPAGTTPFSVFQASDRVQVSKSRCGINGFYTVSSLVNAGQGLMFTGVSLFGQAKSETDNRLEVLLKAR